MAIYRQTIIKDGTTVWCLLSPANIFEALKIAWYMLRHQDRMAALVGVTQSFLDKSCKRIVVDEEQGSFDKILETATSEQQ